ncbi:DUF982 domain-containing protein [Mesorhizobium sp. BAC0120]|uniref:DUF982 domain-containing protein n=1 Tax=Mesorhizobium sp. BAC0120 TaxID=3090670 RepID=UPI00399994AC
MRHIEFDRPVKIALGKPRRARAIKTVIEASNCLKSPDWPTGHKPLSRIAAKQLDAARIGHLTPAEAREAFADAALEAHVLVPAGTKH